MKKTIITIELFLALLAVVLIGFLILVFSKSKKEDSPSLPVVVDTRELYCGISITTPQIGSSVSLPITVAGYVSGCGWDPYLNYVAKMKIYDSQNRLIGRPYLVNRNSGNSSPVSTQFSFKIESLPIKEGPVNFVFENFGVLQKTMTLPVNIIIPAVDESLE